MGHIKLFLDNDNDIQLNNLQIAGTTIPSTGAAVTVQLKNGASVVAGTSNPITLAGTSADYSGTLESTNFSSPAFKHNTRLTIEYTVTSATGTEAFFIKEARARKRELQ